MDNNMNRKPYFKKILGQFTFLGVEKNFKGVTFKLFFLLLFIYLSQMKKKELEKAMAASPLMRNCNA